MQLKWLFCIYPVGMLHSTLENFAVPLKVFVLPIASLHKPFQKLKCFPLKSETFL
jgi:hypothetical protein